MRLPFYFPGFVSLICIPLVLLFFQSQIKKRQNVWAIPLVTADREFFESNQSVFAAFRGSFVPKRMYEDFQVGGSEKENIRHLEEAMVLIREINSTSDTVNGVHFHFGNKSQYADFVRLIDSLRTSNFKSYLTYDSETWVYMLPKIEDEKKQELVLMECVLRTMIVKEDKTLSKGQGVWRFSNLMVVTLYIFMATVHFRTAANVRLGTNRESFPVR
jgi:hypothetical protein